MKAIQEFDFTSMRKLRRPYITRSFVYQNDCFPLRTVRSSKVLVLQTHHSLKSFVPSSYIIDITSAFPSFILHILANFTTIIKWYFLLLRIMFYTKIHQKEQCDPCNEIIQSKRHPRKFQPEILQIFISLSWGRKIIPFNRLQRRSLCLYSLLIFLNNPHINFYIFCWNPMWQKIFNGWICFSTGP